MPRTLERKQQQRQEGELSANSVSGDDQRLLDVVAAAFSGTFAEPDFRDRLQHIKGLFFDRKYLDIFCDARNLPVYAARYTSYRSLAYLDLCQSLPEVMAVLTKGDGRVLCLGGGAGSELAVLGFLASVQQKSLQLLTLDIGDYSAVLQALENALRTTFDACTLNASFTQANLLEMSPTTCDHIAHADLVTLLFTLNELFATSKASAIKFIAALAKSMAPGALLLVADSAGSFSDIQIGTRTYHITVLLDRMPGLRKLHASDSSWYRVPEQLRYPLKLENMRYFLRLYMKEA
ncbi:hypothetical protein RI367_000742 [Sorochytrium milnesiophthora]